MPINKMTLKQLKTIEELPKNGFNIAKAMRKAGFTEASSRAGTTYRALRKITQRLDFFSPERIKRDIAQTRELAIKKNDITNLNRIDEHRTKIAGMITDKSEVDNKTPERVVIVYGVPHKPLAEKENSAQLSEAIDNKQDI